MEAAGPCFRDDATGQRTSTEGGESMKMGLEMWRESIGWDGRRLAVWQELDLWHSWGLTLLTLKDVTSTLNTGIFLLEIIPPTTCWELVVTFQAHLQWQGTAWVIITVCSSPLMTETTTGAVVTVLHHAKPGGTITVPALTSMASTSMELTTAMVSGGIPSTQLRVATHSSGRKWNWDRSDEQITN